MDLRAVMTEIGAALGSIPKLRVYDFPPYQVQVPAAVVTWPDTCEFDAAYQRGMDRLTLPVVVMVGKAWDRTSRDRLAAYLDGSGAASVKAVAEAGTYTAFDSLRVMSADIDFVQMAQVDYLAATFQLDIIGSGT